MTSGEEMTRGTDGALISFRVHPKPGIINGSAESDR